MATLNESSSSASAALLNELPMEKWWGAMDLHQWDGFWYRTDHLEGAMRAQSCFKARDDDVLLASSMKTGTTWLKALIPSIVNRDDIDDPLIQNHPNALMPSLEIQIFNAKSNSDDIPSPRPRPRPRLFRTHVPYSNLADSIKNISFGCKIVYITRDPKDAFVSLWHFMNSKLNCPINEAFDSFCRGVHPFGPFHDHVLGYWKESLKRPEKILFLRYEELKRDPSGQVKKLALFLGRPFVNEEEVDKVLWRCSLERLKNLDVNKNGDDPWVRIPKRAYFRLGLVGDWKNSLSMEMKERLDQLTCIKLQGSALDLYVSN